MNAVTSLPPGVEVLPGQHDLLAVADQWNRLAEASGSPFYTAEWLNAWWNAFGSGAFTCLTLRNDDGLLQAVACCERRGNRLTATANANTEDWDVLAADDQARRTLWRALAELGAGRLHLRGLRHPAGLDIAHDVLGRAGYSIAESIHNRSPYLQLPGTFDQLLGSVSPKLRKQLRYYRRALEREGHLRFRTTVGGEWLERDLTAFFRLEGSSWKARAGTAILSDRRTERLYRDFVHAAACAGWLRLGLLELNGEPIAGDLGCAFAGGSFLIKTGFDERYGRLSPGLVLRGEALRTSIEEGSRFYDFMGGPEAYKLRWTAELRPRVTIRAYRGVWRPLVVYHTRIRPVLKAAVVQMRTSRKQGRRS